MISIGKITCRDLPNNGVSPIAFTKEVSLSFIICKKL